MPVVRQNRHLSRVVRHAAIGPLVCGAAIGPLVCGAAIGPLVCGAAIGHLSLVRHAAIGLLVCGAACGTNLLSPPSGEPMFSLCKEVEKICRTLQSHVMLIWEGSRTASFLSHKLPFFS